MSKVGKGKVVGKRKNSPTQPALSLLVEALRCLSVLSVGAVCPIRVGWLSHISLALSMSRAQQCRQTNITFPF